MHVIAFAGPSRPAVLDPAIDWRPPAAAGDLMCLIEERPDRVVLIDGYFDVRPAPWHKEILLLIEQGITVIGAASMGALRAAELAPYGMIGIGAIFSAYRRGRLVADDEVAVLHAPDALGWRPLTEPLVNVRANILRAVHAHVVAPASARIILEIATDLNFRDREWRLILDRARARLGADPIDLLARWLANHRIDWKARDAARAIRFARHGRPADAEPVHTPRTCFLRNLGDHKQIRLPEMRPPVAAGWARSDEADGHRIGMHPLTA
ncbi:tfuA protein [Sphingomonas sp. AP4-R1]|uniref:TfuA-like protein n=1 Tax=Sphingomonas sp. AP4-R1 TaxID=2735134 RepID=UPI00149390CB|nr:TfuA-like protein [Sphingomonas sp. AP4-R1]QJU59080.1 tfuA protein [Sphingomonas sp. AP4-R1]